MGFFLLSDRSLSDGCIAIFLSLLLPSQFQGIFCAYRKALLQLLLLFLLFSLQENTIEFTRKKLSFFILPSNFN